MMQGHDQPISLLSGPHQPYPRPAHDPRTHQADVRWPGRGHHRPQRHAAIGRLDDTPAINVYVRAIREQDPREVRGGWTFAGGLYAIRELHDENYRIEVAMTPTGGSLWPRWARRARAATGRCMPIV